MEKTDETFIKNGFMFIYARQNIPTAEKISNIEKILKDGAYINFPDANDKNNTILHIATQREEKDIVELLLSKGALLINNSDNKTPLQLAKEKDTELSKEIFNILTKNGKHYARINSSSSRNLQSDSIQNRSICQNNSPTSPIGIQYQKRDGTSAISGQFYETKLLSLVLHRALHDTEIEECYLATNINDIGDFDDVCFRFKIQEDGETKHVICFIQAKHREDATKNRLSVKSLEGASEQFRLVKYFDSFVKIKEKFLKKNPMINDPMFEGEFNDVDCYFILYTNLEKYFDRILTGNKPICHKLHDFINTGKDKEDVFQFDYKINEINSLTKYVQQKRMKALGKHLLTSILSCSKEIMNNDLMKIYHPALAQNVIELTENEPNYFNGKFRDDFLDSNDDHLITLKSTLYEEIVIKQAKKTALTAEEVKEKIEAIVNNPSAQTISTLIGHVILFDNKSNKLYVDGKKYESNILEINHCLQKCQVTQALVNDAINISGKNKLKSLTFKLPYTFGNSDFPKVKKPNKLKLVANEFYELINDAKQHLENEIIYPVEICICDKNLGPEKEKKIKHLTDTLGIAGTVGNLLQFDKETQTFTFNTSEESLGQNSKTILREIRKLTQDDLTRYKIKVKINNFPRTSFEPNENDTKLAEEFLSKLWFYTNQANEEAVESILKREIDDHYNVDKSQNQFLFRVHTDALFLRFHDEIQKWWKSQSPARYLTKTDTIFDEAKKKIINSPVLTVLNFMFLRSLKKMDIEFDAKVIKSMNIEKKIENKKILNILSRAVILSAHKIMQVLKLQNNNNKYRCSNYTFVNLDYIHILPEGDKNKLINELSETKAVTLVIICETSLDERHQTTINEIIKIYQEQIIVITDKPLQEKTYLNHQCITINDENINLCDLSVDSQTRVLGEYKICYQGKEVPLNALIDNKSKTLINAKFLWSLLNKMKIEIGDKLDSVKYNEIKDHYVNRRLLLDDAVYEVNTLYDIKDTTVLITSKPCMGKKSILLTHLSLETKKIDPKPWIIRINMSAHNNDFVKWKLNVTHVMRFLCNAALKKTDNIKSLYFTESADRTVKLKSHNLEDMPYELKWLLHFYNQGKVIILFDGFDKIHPHFTKEGIELLLELKRANKRMWITSNCYIVHILERELGKSYTLESLSINENESLLRKFWKTNLKLEKLNHQQQNNISIFIKYFMKLFKNESNAFSQERPMIPFLSIPLHFVYLMAIDYFKNEINSLSPEFIRETIIKKWRLNSYTRVDRSLRQDEEKSLELAGTPLHMYIAENYFKFKIRDEVEFNIDKDVINERSNVYLNAISAYELFLKNNIRHICEIENKTNKNVEKEQDKVRDVFFQTHRKIALYAIFKESDIPKVLTGTEILEVKSILKKFESGEIKSEFIDCVVDGIPQFYNALYAEYFLVEFASDLLKRVFRGDIEHITVESLWNFLVNGILTVSPPGVRNAFNYKLKYDPELAKAADSTAAAADKIIFNLILKQNKEAGIAGRDADTCINIAIREGLVNVTNLLLKSARRYSTRDNIGGFLSVLKSGAFILGAANPSWKQVTLDVMRCIDTVDGESLIEIIKSNELEGVSQTLTSLYDNTDTGRELQEKIKKELRPIKDFTEKVVEGSGKNANLVKLLEELPYHLPEIINSIFNKTNKQDNQQGNSSHDSDALD